MFSPSNSAPATVQLFVTNKSKLFVFVKNKIRLLISDKILFDLEIVLPPKLYLAQPIASFFGIMIIIIYTGWFFFTVPP